MKKKILQHLTVKGFVIGEDLTNCERLEKKLEEAKLKFKHEKKQVADAKQKLKVSKKEISEARKKLNNALEESLAKIEIDQMELKKTKKNESDDSILASVFDSDQLKAKYEETLNDLETKKNEIKKKIEEFKLDKSEKWDSFKNKLSHDLDEFGKVLKGLAS